MPFAIMVVVFCARRPARQIHRRGRNPAKNALRLRRARCAARRTLEILLTFTARALPTKEEVAAAILVGWGARVSCVPDEIRHTDIGNRIRPYLEIGDCLYWRTGE